MARRVVRKVVARSGARGPVGFSAKARTFRVVPKPKPVPKRSPFAGLKAAALKAVRSKPAAKKPSVMRLVKKPAGKATAPRAATGRPSSSSMPAQDDELLLNDESTPSPEEEPAGSEDSGESSEDSSSDEGGDESPEESDGGDEGAEGEGEEVGALLDFSSMDPVKAITLGWVLFGVTLSGAMAIGWAVGRNQHARR